MQALANSAAALRPRLKGEEKCNLRNLVVPANTRRLTRLSKRRRNAFEAKMWSDLEEIDFSATAAATTTPADVSDVSRDACGTCRGFCCAWGGTHAFLGKTTLARIATERSITNHTELATLYFDLLPERSYSGSCVFHTQRGCALPRDLRADICNSFVCGGLQAYLTDESGGRPQPQSAGPVIMATTGDKIIRAARSTQDGPAALRLPVSGRRQP